MAFESIDPSTGETFFHMEPWGEAEREAALAAVAAATPGWAATPVAERAEAVRAIAGELRRRADELATLITREVGKLHREARGEIEKCAWVCEYYADHGPGFLADEPIETDAGKSLVAYQPLGTVLAVMPWNFPFWQVFRFAAPALVAGNTGVLKHASNVPQSALAIEEVIRDAGLPADTFRTLMIRAADVDAVIDDPRIAAVTLTGSEPAGRAVASRAAANIKKAVLELGGSDPFIVLDDADVEQAVEAAATSRFLNNGQSCIAAKRFILTPGIADDFVERFRRRVEAMTVGDPAAETTQLGPMARTDLRDELHTQVADSVRAGAQVVTGCTLPDSPGAFYPPSILDHVAEGQRAFEEELFGPVAIVLRADDAEHAVNLANGSRFGLGGAVWTADSQRGEAIARRLECGAAFVNGIVKSDPRLPFGGVKASGFGRELSRHGIQEFVNAKTVWVK
ncbi:succinate-semialdehyde dehydrogenase / glutarate-semialdehyde dehydrogenase [Thiohalospira halophila DSM 15071]|uniref:Succinate-semialdehyde dehydrogenase / glutarate-semialdehyde dehydrogenase n=1 Tax=Thiohalospira halophila DSM 15071 TaxID=1123397 RepID=A0A1I1Q5L8_9GAMM|nr:NAD-dependent succinate-semialdehyde dehydrogenase [Thiohalospira halophila]SFD17431.1 succinate-semialdehyde dehydrogenase / glutarate-semialdehyde dehydrogenase [Thiohalospira halophila DSM 15071]